MTDTEWVAEVWQDGMCVASAYASTEEDARREGLHYAAQYAQDGPVMLAVKVVGQIDHEGLAAAIKENNRRADEIRRSAAERRKRLRAALR